MLRSGPAALLAGISLILPGYPALAPLSAYTHPTILEHVRAIACRVLPCEARCELGEEVVGGRVEDSALEPVIPKQKKAWEASLGGEEAARPYVAARLAALPSRRPVRPLPADDRELVRRVAADTWRGLEGLLDREHQLPVDHVHLLAQLAWRLAGEHPAGDRTNVLQQGPVRIRTQGGKGRMCR